MDGPDLPVTAGAEGARRVDGAPEKVVLVDGSGYIFRAFYALPPMTRPDGTPVNAVYGFTNMLIKLKEDVESEHIAVLFDSSRKSFRNDIFSTYKANRSEPPDELVPQFDLIRDATRAMALPCIELPGYEADDLIATYARMAREVGSEVLIVTSDKDLMQLVRDGIRILDPRDNSRIGPDEVVLKFGVPPDKVIDVQALAGDSSDNVPGVPGIGIKTAAELINAYGDLDTLLARAEEIKQPKRRERLIEFADQARTSRELVTLRDDAPVTDGLDDLRLHDPNPEVLLAFLREQGFKSIAARVQSRLGLPSEPGATVDVDVETEEKDYTLVRSEAELRTWIEAATHEGYVAIDTKATSPDCLTAELIGIALSVEPGKACYIPLGHVAPKAQGSLDLGDGATSAGEAPAQIPRETALAMLKPLFEDPGVLKVGHNVKFHLQVLGQPRYGIRLAPIDDTMLLSYVLHGGKHSHGLDELAQIHLGRTTIKYSDVAGSGKNQIGFPELPLDKARDYAAEGADVAGRLHRLLKPRLVQDRVVTVYETIERALVPVLAEMECAGIKVDAEELVRLSADFDRRGAEIAAEIHRLAGREFNIGSPKQLGEVLFDEMGLDGGRKGKTGAYATGADVLETLAAQGHDLPARVLDWRQLSKLKSTYTDALVGQINPATGRVHTSYAQAVASTGRLSSNDPNLQNIPIRTEEGRKIRHAFMAETGHVLLSADYSQIELRLLAHVADIAALKEAFRAGADIHAMTASEVFGIPIDGMDPAVRNRAKAINFGIIYGISAFGLGRQLGIPQGEARSYIDTYFKHYPGIRDYTERTKTFARAHGYVTTIFGRKCHTPGIQDKNPAMRSFSERAAINAPLQGSAADIIKRAMIRVPDALRGAGLAARMLLQVHDELVFEVPQAEVGETASVVTKVMENAAHLSVPLVVEIGTGDNWADAH